MESYSIILLITMLLMIFLVTFYFYGRQKQKNNKLMSKQEPRFDILMEPTPIQNDNQEDRQFDEQEDQYDLLHDPLLGPGKEEKKISPETTKTAPEETMYIILAAKPDRPYVGYELLQSLLAAGLRFGAMNLFHRHEDLNGKGKILFSVASASETGTFEINKMGAYSGKGLMMFLKLSNHKDLALSFDTMLDTASQLIEELGGDILDEQHKILTTEKMAVLRKKVLEFEQKQRIGDLFDS